jgi:outer membrane translocation and assembly module TamA
VLLTSGQLTANLETLRDMKITKIYGEWQDEALNEKNAAIVALTEEIPKAKDREFEAAENDRRRQEEEDSQRVENEQRIAREAVEAAEIEAKQELQDKLDEEQRLKDEQEARERNTQHKGKVHREIAADITTMLVPYAANADLDELSKKLVKAMVKGQIRHTTINY